MPASVVFGRRSSPSSAPSNLSSSRPRLHLGSSSRTSTTSCPLVFEKWQLCHAIHFHRALDLFSCVCIDRTIRNRNILLNPSTSNSRSRSSGSSRQAAPPESTGACQASKHRVPSRARRGASDGADRHEDTPQAPGLPLSAATAVVHLQTQIGRTEKGREARTINTAALDR